ncbi:MAG: hypothetical protein WA941_15375 [Nitrososphaeraceae archaeon]
MLKSPARDTVKRVLADGAYDSRDNFQFLLDNDIDPAIKVRKNSFIIPEILQCYSS